MLEFFEREGRSRYQQSAAESVYEQTEGLFRMKDLVDAAYGQALVHTLELDPGHDRLVD